jgi:tRNA1Val (adenine37-N6)-methyltransferase
MKKVRDFRFKQFTVSQDESTHKVGTDGVLLGAWVDVSECENILDVGTGSGVIALMLAQRTAENVVIHAVEIQPQDSRQARKNFEASPWNERLTLHETSVQGFSPANHFDLIVSNPPYFIDSWLPPSDSRTTVRHTTHLSFEDLLKSVVRLLNPAKGKFAVILPFSEAQRFIKLAELSHLFPVRECAFKSRGHKPVERLLLEFSFGKKLKLIEELTLYRDNEGEEWSNEYKELTRQFYLKI